MMVLVTGGGGRHPGWPANVGNNDRQPATRRIRGRTGEATPQRARKVERIEEGNVMAGLAGCAGSWR